jgi:hypothetical protein
LVIPEGGTPTSIYKDLECRRDNSDPKPHKGFTDGVSNAVAPPPKETAPNLGARGRIKMGIEDDASPAYHRAGAAARFEQQHAHALALEERWSRKKRWLSFIPFDRRIAYFRLPELERIFASRYGLTLPDDDAGRGDLFIALNHIAYRSGDVLTKMLGWARRWAPWLTEAEARHIAIGIAKHPIRWKADTLGQRLRLTREERTRLGIKTIGACDASKAECEREWRDAWNAKRRKQTRDEYEANARAGRAEAAKAGINYDAWRKRRQRAGASQVAPMSQVRVSIRSLATMFTHTWDNRAPSHRWGQSPMARDAIAAGAPRAKRSVARS